MTFGHKVIAKSHQELRAARLDCETFRMVLSHLDFVNVTRPRVCSMMQVKIYRRRRVTIWPWLRFLRVYVDSKVSGSRWRQMWRARDTLLLVPICSVSFLAWRWPYLSSGRGFRVVESNEVRINIVVLVPHREEVSFQMVMHWPECVVIVKTRVQFRGLTKVSI